jgi:hypothetical protein
VGGGKEENNCCGVMYATYLSHDYVFKTLSSVIANQKGKIARTNDVQATVVYNVR